MWENSLTQFMTTLKNLNNTKLKKFKLWQNFKYEKLQFMKKKKNFKMVF